MPTLAELSRLLVLALLVLAILEIVVRLPYYVVGTPESSFRCISRRPAERRKSLTCPRILLVSKIRCQGVNARRMKTVMLLHPSGEASEPTKLSLKISHYDRCQKV